MATKSGQGAARPTTDTAIEPVLTHPERLLWPADGISKGDLDTYYQAVASALLPHLRDRPLVLRPFPRGVEQAGYWRQSLPATAPDWLDRYEHQAKADGRPNAMLVVNDERALRWLVNQGGIELHAWLSRRDEPDQPDAVVFDLDVSGPARFPLAREAALLARAAVTHLGLSALVKTSGGDGLHIYLPIGRGRTFDETRAWATALADTLVATHPALLTTDLAVAGRADKVLLDVAQNSLGRTTVAAYSVRPRPGATVSTPLTWAEVEGSRFHPGDFTIATVPQRLRELGDLFAPALIGGQTLPAL